LPSAKQPRFENPPNCVLEKHLCGLNNWKILKIGLDKDKKVQEEID
jgi:hypothetical protein